jgi:quinol monooxygenase YgiN
MNMRRPPSNARVKRLCRVLYGLLAVLTVPLVAVGVSHLKPASFSVNDATVRIRCAEPRQEALQASMRFRSVGPEVISRMKTPSGRTVSAPASSQSNAAGGNEIFHVAVFRFTKEHADEAIAAFRALASASRQESGNLAYDIYRGIDDDQEFYVVEHWASPAALAAHARTEAFVKFGQGVLVRNATLHDTVTASAFDISPAHNRGRKDQE